MKELQVERVYVDRASDKNTNRPQLKAMLGYVCEGDSVTVESYSIIAISVKDLLDIVDTLKSKNVVFKSVKKNTDTSSPAVSLICLAIAKVPKFIVCCD